MFFLEKRISSFSLYALLLSSSSLVPLLAEVGAEVVGEAPVAGNNAPLQADPRQDLFRIANMVYDQAQASANNPQEKVRLLTLAAGRYADYVKRFPNEENTQQAMYRGALCMLELGRANEAQPLLVQLVSQYKSGPFVAASAYRLGSMAFKASNFKAALSYYSLTAKVTDKLELKTDATYRLARCYLMLNQKEEAATTFAGLANDPATPDLFRNAALISLAGLDVEANRLDRALATYSQIANAKGVDPESLGKALLQAANIALNMQKYAEAEDFYHKILRNPKLAVFTGEAQVGVMTAFYRQKKYDQVLLEMRKNPLAIEKNLESRRALLAGQSAFELKKYPDAISYFGRVEALAPLTEMAFESAYRRLLCSQEMKLSNMDSTVQIFMDTYAGRFPTSPYIHMVRVMLADELSRTKPEAAAPLFLNVDLDKLPPEMRADVLYKKAWVLAGVKDRVAAQRALDDFISQYQSDPRLPEALVLRGEMFSQTNDEVGAMTDFNRVIEAYPKKEIAATAWQRAAQLYQNKQDTANMIKYYEGLIKNFPKTKPAAIADAHYMIGKGYYDTKKYEKAVEHLEEASKLRPDKYKEPSDILLVTTFYQLQDYKRLKDTYDRIRKDNRQMAESIPESIPAWLGSQCFSQKDYKGADTYLSMASDSSEPQRTKKVIWSTLAKARLRSGSFEKALKAIDFYLAAEDAPSRKAQGFLDKAVILANLKNWDEAKKAAEEALTIGVEGPIRATLNVTLGDIAFARNDFAEAARLYGTTASLFTSDRELKPQALYKAAVALEKAGKNEEAHQYAQDLKAEFPQWRPSETIFTPTN